MKPTIQTQLFQPEAGDYSFGVPKSLQKDLPTEAQMFRLKRELNVLLWTDDPPRLMPMPTLVECNQPLQTAAINMQCVAHALITGAIFFRRGFQATIHGGRAFVLDPSPSNSPHDDCLNQIMKHWWVSVQGFGLVDLSLFAETEHPLVYRNRSCGDRWKILFRDSGEGFPAFLRRRERGCFYVTMGRKLIASIELAQALAQTFPPAEASGILLPHMRIVEHCERVLGGSAENLAHLPQKEIWRRLAN